MSDPATARVGPIELEPGIRRRHVGAYCFAAFFSIGLTTVLNFLQAYILNQHLGIPTGEQGRLSGDLNVVNELVALTLVVPLGMLSDRIGRRPIFVAGLVLLAAAYVFYPLVDNRTELLLCRILHSFGAAGVAGMIGILAADYAQHDSRGKLVALGSMLIGLGVVFIVRAIGQVPEILTARGTDPVEAGITASWIVAGLCLFAALVLRFGLKGGPVATTAARTPALELVRTGILAARNPRIAVAYGAAFVSRADQSIMGLFVSLWAVQAGLAQGLGGEAVSRATTPFIIAAISGLLWAPLFGALLDRLRPMSGIALSLLIGGAGFSAVALVDDPIAAAALPAFAFLGIGQMSTLIGAQTLISKEAPRDVRGSVIGMFGFCGAVGIMLTALVGGRLFDGVAPTAPFAMVGALQFVLMLAALAVSRSSAAAG